MSRYVYTGGNLTVTDYTPGDIIKIASGSISKTELTTNGTDVKFMVGSGSVLVKNGKGKVISLEDSRGSYTVSDTRIALGADFTGEMDAGKYLSTVTNIAGSGAAAAVTLRGNTNNNVMSGGAKADTMYGGEGADKLYGYGGNDVLYGQQGNDYLYGGEGADKLYGGSGDDAIYGNAGNDVLDGYTGDDTLTGGTGNDTLSGGAGSDLFVYANGDGSDTVKDYTAGEDTIKIAGGSISKTELGSNGTDVKFTIGSGSVLVKSGKGKVISLEDSRGSYTVSDTRIALGKVFTGEMDAGKYLSTVTNIAGSSATIAVTLRGNANANVMSGGSQADTLYGGEGADKLYGYGGNDVLYGQQGNDSLYGGAGADKLYGGSGDDVINGDAGNDVLDGYTGNDTLTGGAGNDTLSGGAGSDLFVYANGDGSDTVKDYTAEEDTIKIASGSIRKTELGSNGKDVIFTVDNGGITAGSVTVQNGKGKVISLEDSRGSYTVSDTRIALGADFKGEMNASKYLSTVTNIAGSGATTAVTLWGNANNNVMSGGAQADTLYGGDGADKLYGYAGDDEMLGGNGNDTLYGGTGTDYLCGQAGNDILYGGDGGDGLDGGDGDDTLYGGNGDDGLLGGEGNNTLYGGAGNDTYECEGRHGAHDTIEDYQSGELIRHFLPYLDSVHLGTGSVDLRLRNSNNTETMVITVKGDISLDKINLDGYSGRLADYIDGSSEAGVVRNATGSNKTITGTEYADDITLESGSGNTIIALGGQDTITINGTSSTTHGNNVFGGEGNDIIHVNAGQNSEIYGEAGDDFIELSGYGKTDVSGGTGSDVYQLTNRKGDVEIDQTAFSAGDSDCLDLQCYLPESAGTSFTLNNEGIMNIKVGERLWKDGSIDGIGEINVSGWDVNPLGSILYYVDEDFSSIRAVMTYNIKTPGTYEIVGGVMTRV